MSDHPELDGYEPYEERPMRRGGRTIAVRIVVALVIAALILPGVATTVSVGARNAQAACEYRGAVLDPQAPGFDAKFELFGEGFIGWECYSTDAFDGDHHLTSLGPIPFAPRGEAIDTNES